MSLTASLPFDLSVAALSFAVFVSALAAGGLVPWCRRIAAGCAAARSLAAGLARTVAGVCREAVARRRPEPAAAPVPHPPWPAYMADAPAPPDPQPTMVPDFPPSADRPTGVLPVLHERSQP
jgi:hypothetical protein